MKNLIWIILIIFFSGCVTINNCSCKAENEKYVKKIDSDIKDTVAVGYL